MIPSKEGLIQTQQVVRGQLCAPGKKTGAQALPSTRLRYLQQAPLAFLVGWSARAEVPLRREAAPIAAAAAQPPSEPRNPRRDTLDASFSASRLVCSNIIDLLCGRKQKLWTSPRRQQLSVRFSGSGRSPEKNRTHFVQWPALSISRQGSTSYSSALIPMGTRSETEGNHCGSWPGHRGDCCKPDCRCCIHSKIRDIVNGTS
jgi:hypothetical protein